MPSVGEDSHDVYLCHYPGVMMSGATDDVTCSTGPDNCDHLDLVSTLVLRWLNITRFLCLIVSPTLAKNALSLNECNKQVSIVPKLINCWSTILTSTFFMFTAAAILGAKFINIQWLLKVKYSLSS